MSVTIVPLLSCDTCMTFSTIRNPTAQPGCTSPGNLRSGPKLRGQCCGDGVAPGGASIAMPNDHNRTVRQSA